MTRTIPVTLAGEPARIIAPTRGAFDRAAFDADLPIGGHYGLDVESTALHPQLDQHTDLFAVRLVQLASTSVAWVLDPGDPQQRQALRDLLGDDTTSFVSHTSMDVISVRRAFDIDISGRNTDTHVLAGLAHPDKAGRGGLDLKTLVEQYVGPELGQAQAALDRRFDELWTGRSGASRGDRQAHGWSSIELDDTVYLAYAGLDALAVRRLEVALRQAIRSPEHIIDLDLWLAGRLAERQGRGYRVDVHAAKALVSQCDAAMEKPAHELAEITGGLRPTQAQKLSAWLMERGVTGEMSSSGTQLKLSKDALPDLLTDGLDKPSRRVVGSLIEIRRHQDGRTKGAGLLDRVDGDGRVHPRLLAIGAPTARMSCSGFNLQAVAKGDARQRGLFLPTEGRVLIGADFDQIELRVVAALAGEQSMYDTVASGGDLHQLTADRIGVERKVAKAVNFMIVYGGSGRAVAEATGLPLQECYGHVDAFHRAYPAISQLSQRCSAMTSITTITGRHLETAKGRDGDRAYANINYLVQSSARDLMVIAWRRFTEAFGDVMWLAIHDELIAEVPVDRVDEACRALETAMTFTFRGMPFSASAVPLIDETGTSRWMSIDHAEEVKAATSSRNLAA